MKNLILLIAFVFIFNPLLAQDKVKEAEDLIKKKDYAKAFNIAKDLYDAKDYNNVIKILMNLKEKDKNNKKVIELLGDAYNSTRVYELALGLFQEAEKLDSTDINLKFKIAKIFFRNQEYTDAANKFLEILSYDSTNTKALEELGYLLYAAKEYSSAVIYLSKLLNYEKKLDIYQYAVKSYLKIRNYQKAYDYAKEGLEKYPGDQELTRDFVTASVETKNLNSAVKFIETLPDSLVTANDYYKIAVTYQVDEKNDSLALVYYLKTLEKDSTNEQALKYASILAYKTNRSEIAEDLYKRRLAINDKDYEAAKFLSFVYWRDKKYDLAAEWFKNTLAISDSDPTMYYFYANALNLSKQENEAFEVFKTFLNKVQDKEEAYKSQVAEVNGMLGLRLFALKRHNEAIPYLRKALQYEPRNVDYNLWLASCYHQTEKLADAINYYKIVLKLDPKNAAATKALKSLGEL